MIAKISKGGSFRGALNYVLGKEKAELIGGNMIGETARELSSEYGRIRQIKKDIEKPVYHVSLALPEGESFTPEQWQTVAADYLSQMGLDPSTHQYIVAQHQDTKHQHVHIIANRISLDGELFNVFRDQIKSKDVCRRLEAKYGLTEVSNEKKTYRAKTTQKERQMNKRTGRTPEKVLVQEALNKLLGGEKPTHRELISALEADGIIAIPNIASTGKMNGYSFQYGGRNYTGSQTGYAWKHLQNLLKEPDAETVAYLQHRREVLQQGTPADAVRSIRNSVWEMGVRRTSFGEALQKQGWTLQGKSITKGEVSYKLADLVDVEKLTGSILQLQQISTEAREQARAKASKLAKSFYTPRRSFMAEVRAEDLLVGMIMVPQAVLFLLALSVVTEAVRGIGIPQNEKELEARLKEIWAESSQRVDEAVSQVRKGVEHRGGGRTTGSNQADSNRFEGNGRKSGAENSGRGPDDEKMGAGLDPTTTGTSPDPRRTGGDGEGLPLAAVDPDMDRPVGDVGRDGPATPESQPAGSQQGSDEATPALGAVAVHEWAALAADLKIVTGADEMSTESLSKKMDAWAAQSVALGAQRYSLKCIPRDEPGRAKPRSPWLVEQGRPLSVDEVNKYLKTLTNKNMAGYDIYIRPEDPTKHYIMIDDLSFKAVRKMQADGFTPAATWQTSSGSYQAIFVYEKNRTYGYADPRRTAEERALRELQRELTRTYGGDEKNLGLDKDFRLCGFANKKPGRNNFFTRVYEAPGGECPRLRELIEKKTASLTPAAVNEEIQRREAVIRGETTFVVDRSRIHETSDEAFEVYIKTLKKHRGLVKKMGWNSDPSTIDFRIAVEMLSDGWHPASVADAIRECSPDFPRRHGDPDAYLSKTITSAQAKVRSDEARREGKREAPSIVGERGL